MARPTVDQIFNRLRFNTNGIFDVTFNRRTNRTDGTAAAGDARHMICYGGGQGSPLCQGFKRNIIPMAVRDAEDLRCAVLTVWSMDTFWRLQAELGDDQLAAERSWRRIDLVTITALPNIYRPQDLPPNLRANMHRITNAFRLANMPRQPI